MLSNVLRILKSKTVWTAVAIAVFTAYDQDLQNWIANHSSHAGKAVAVLMLTLRVLTVGPLVEGGGNGRKSDPHQ